MTSGEDPMNAGFSRLAIALVVALGITAADLGGLPAHATPQMWTFPTLPIQVGIGGSHATLSGHFYYDYDTNIYSNINVTVSESATWGTVDFVEIAPFALPTQARGNYFIFVNTDHSVALNVLLYSSMTNEDSLAPLQSVTEAYCLSFMCNAQHQPRLDGWNYNTAFITSSLSIPEPNTLTIVAVAVAGLRLLRRRQKDTA
jgi:hypothetical protein